jgi:Sigma-54 interaction domain
MIPRYAPTLLHLTKSDEDRGCVGEDWTAGLTRSWSWSPLSLPRTLRTDARLIAATNRDLTAMVAAPTFRADLFSRVNVFPVHVPPLRERPDTIPLLVRYCAQPFARRRHKTIETIPAETMHAFIQYPWLGNIRGPAEDPRAGGAPLPRARVAGASHRPQTSGHRCEPLEPRHPGRGRTPAHPGRDRGDEWGAWRTERRRDTPGDEALDPTVPPGYAGGLPPPHVHGVLPTLSCQPPEVSTRRQCVSPLTAGPWHRGSHRRAPLPPSLGLPHDSHAPAGPATRGHGSCLSLRRTRREGQAWQRSDQPSPP